MTTPFDAVPRLPHAAPFLLLDRVLEVGERSGVFVKLVSAADPCVGRDGLLPAAFVLEALAQGGGALLAARGGNAPLGGYLAAVDDFRLLGEFLAIWTCFYSARYTSALSHAARVPGCRHGGCRRRHAPQCGHGLLEPRQHRFALPL